MTEKSVIATLAGGCFWCLEAIFENITGVKSVKSGYSGGHIENPSYEHVCQGTTGHTEVVQIEFDPKVISYKDLLGIFFTIHDPTTPNRQGADVGSQYRSAIFYHDADQKENIIAVLEEINLAEIWENPIITEISPFEIFYIAENNHQNYFANNPDQPYCRAVVAPKVAKFRSKYKKFLN